MKRRLIAAATALAVAVGVAAFCTSRGKQGSITVAQYQKIQVGMTRQQVYDLLGGPPRNESNVCLCAYHTSDRYWWDSLFRSEVGPGEWWGPDIVVDITFDGQNKVCGKWFRTHEHGTRTKSSLWDGIRSRLP
jgi:outer membrane protein assembly factor BamE (lipoprotein component of BamABCDE complex)